MKKILKIAIYNENKKPSIQKLKLSEAHLLSKIAQENKSVEVWCIEITKEDYNLTFGITA